MKRGQGRTTMQMLESTNSAIFVWVNGYLDYPRRLAQFLGRNDLKIVSPIWLENSWRGIELTGVVVDHAALLTSDQLHGYRHAITRIRPYKVFK